MTTAAFLPRCLCRFSFRDNRGLTLVELAIVLVIMGILVSLGVGMIGPLTKRAKLSETRESINAAADSVIGFAAANNRLPTIAEFPTVVRTPNDAWGRAFLYVPATLYVNTLPTTVICNSTSTDTVVKICSDVSCTPAANTMNNAAFIIISAGADVINHTGTATPFTTSSLPVP